MKSVLHILIKGVEGKGKILTDISEFWFKFLATQGIDSHFITTDINAMPESVLKYRDQLEGRSMLVKSLDIVQCECIVRGYITGNLNLIL